MVPTCKNVAPYSPTSLNVGTTSPPTLCSTYVLLILFPFFQDDSGWQQVETSLAENKHLNTLALNGCDAFIVNMLRALAMGRNTSIQDLRLYSESLYYIPSHDTLIWCV